MSIRDDDKAWLSDAAFDELLWFSDDEIEQFCDRVDAAVKRDDEPRWVAREFEFKAMLNNERY
jgi:hypothetical protein